jgi:hypothetical protein
MKKLSAGLAAAAALALAAAPAHAQIPHITPFAFEARAGVAVPTGDLNTVANPGFGVSGNITYSAFPLIGIYAGYGYNQFGEDGGNGTYKDHGVDVGARLGIPTPLIPIDPFLKAGVVVHRLELSGSSTGLNGSGDWGAGYEVGAGLGFGLGPASLTPGVTYVRHQGVSYVQADVGLRLRI